MLPAARGRRLSGARCSDAGVTPCGLGARDTLRLEAGMNLYGNDMDEIHDAARVRPRLDRRLGTPERDFIGRAALEAQKAAGVPRKFVGLLLEDRGVLRGHQKVIVAGGGAMGEITSGTLLADAGALHRARARAARHRATAARSRSAASCWSARREGRRSCATARSAIARLRPLSTRIRHPF